MSSQSHSPAQTTETPTATEQPSGWFDGLSNAFQLALYGFGESEGSAGASSPDGGSLLDWVTPLVPAKPFDPFEGWDEGVGDDDYAFKAPAVQAPKPELGKIDPNLHSVETDVSESPGWREETKREGSVGLGGIEHTTTTTEQKADYGTRTQNGFKVDGSGVSATHRVETDDTGWKSGHAVTGGVGPGGAHVGASQTEQEADGSLTTTGIGVSGDGEITYSSNNAWKDGDQENSNGWTGGVDLSLENGIEGGSYGQTWKRGDNTYGAKGAVHSSVERNGATVTWDNSASGGASYGGKNAYGTHGAEGGASVAWKESRTFASPEAAAEYQELLDSGQVKTNRELTADDFASMEPGERIEYSLAADASVGGKADVGGLGVGAKGEGGLHRHTTLKRGEGDCVTLEIRGDGTLGAEGSLGAAGLEVGGGLGYADQRVLSLDFDLSDPEAAAALDAYQKTGKLPDFAGSGVSNVDLRDDTETSAKVSAGLGLFGVGESGSTGSGEALVNGRHAETTTSGYDDTVSGGASWGDWALGGLAGGYRAMESGSSWAFGEDAWLTRTLDKSADGWEKTAQLYADGTLRPNLQGAGSEKGRNTVFEFTDDGSHGIHQRQEFALGDVHENAAALKDQSSKYEDRGLMAHLPDRAASDRKWALDTVMDDEAYESVKQKMVDGEFTVDEFGASYGGLDLNQQVDENTDDATFAEVLQDFVWWGGDDAMESIRHNVTEGSVEHYLELEGDSVWVGKEGNERLDNELAALEDANEVDRDKVDDLMNREWERLEGLGWLPGGDDELNAELMAEYQAKYPEVPPEFRQEEIDRARERLERLAELH